MMTRELLQSWNVEEDIIERFIGNDLEPCHFKDLTEGLLKELCDGIYNISQRLYLKNKIDEYITAESKTSTVPSCPGTPEVSCASELEADIDEDALIDILTSRPPFPEFDLRTLLTTSPTGNSILKFYETNKYLTSKHRNNLTDIIARRIFTRIVNHRISHEEYNILTSKIIALFPTENPGTYFVAPVKKRDSISGKPVFAKGKLVDKIRNTLYKSGEKSQKRNLTVQQNIDHSNTKRSKNIEELQETHKDATIWLKNNSEPWEDVISRWKSTYDFRHLLEYDTVGGFIEKWPILNDVRSYVLINLDFETMHNGKENKFYLNWKNFLNKVATLKKTNVKEEIAELATHIETLPDDDLKLPSEIKLLCLLVPPRGRLNKRQKFSTAECIESFIVTVEKPGDIQKKIDDITQSAAVKGRTVQPYIIHCTSSGDDNTGKFYLVIDKVRYVFDSSYKAFDTLFKSYFALHVSYPKSAHHLYLLIQKCVYNINTEYDVTHPYIADLITNAKC